MLKHLKYYFSAQLVLTTLTYGSIPNFENKVASSKTHEEYDDLFNWLADTSSTTNQFNMPSTASKTRLKDNVDRYLFLAQLLYLKPYFQDTTVFTVLDAPDEGKRALYSSQLFNLNAPFAFRLGFQYKANWLGLENQLAWMRFYTSTKKTYPKSSTPAKTRILRPDWNSHTEPVGDAYIMSSIANIGLNVIDLTSKIPLTPLKQVKLYPKIGLRGVVSNFNFSIQDIKSGYGATQYVFTPPQNIQTSEVKQKFNGVGLVGGFDTMTDLGIGFHFDTVFNAAAVFGNVNTSNLGYYVVPGLETIYNTTYFKAQDNFATFLPIIDGQIKFGWKKDCFDHKVAFDISLGYEIQYFPSFLQFIHQDPVADFIQPTDYFMQGLNFGFAISF